MVKDDAIHCPRQWLKLKRWEELSQEGLGGGWGGKAEPEGWSQSLMALNHDVKTSCLKRPPTHNTTSHSGTRASSGRQKDRQTDRASEVSEFRSHN